MQSCTPKSTLWGKNNSVEIYIHIYIYVNTSRVKRDYVYSTEQKKKRLNISLMTLQAKCLHDINYVNWIGVVLVYTLLTLYSSTGKFNCVLGRKNHF